MAEQQEHIKNSNGQQRIKRKQMPLIGCFNKLIPILLVGSLLFWFSRGMKLDVPGIISLIVGIVSGILQGLVAFSLLSNIRPEEVVPKLTSSLQQSFNELNQEFGLLFGKNDIFISCHRSDYDRAQWIEQELKNDNYLTLLSPWDGIDFLQEMDIAQKRANYILTILSTEYLNMLSSHTEWVQIFKQVHLPGRNNKGTAIKVRTCELGDDLATVVSIDLVGLDKPVASRRLIARIPVRPHGKDLAHSLSPDNDISPISMPIIPSIWNVPYGRNEFFTGRDKFLIDLHDSFRASETTLFIQHLAITGLSGMGKTQAALEYAYRYSYYYQAVLWINGSSSDELLLCCQKIAPLLEKQKGISPVQVTQDNMPALAGQADAISPVDTVKMWLENNPNWLLILDKCNDLMLVRNFVPLKGRGHVILTTRMHDTPGIAHSLELKSMEPEEGACFLLCRIKLIKSNETIDKASVSDQEIARKISIALGGLPLGIEHAGAYINDKKCGLSGYLHLYRTQRAAIFSTNPDLQFSEPEFQTIATTWSLSFNALRETNPGAEELLEFCAFLSSDPIPEEFITQAPDLGVNLKVLATNPIEFNRAIGDLRKFSLIDRSPGTKTLIVHPVVQAVIKDGAYEDKEAGSGRQFTCAKRAVLAVNSVFPEVEFENWRLSQRQLCQRYLPHALACTTLIEELKLDYDEAIRLLYVTGCYLQEVGHYQDAEHLLSQALTLREKKTGEEYPDLIDCLISMAELYHVQGKYEMAEALYQRAFAATRQLYAQETPKIANILDNLGRLYDDWGKYNEVEQLYLQALDIRKRAYGSKHVTVAASLNNLAGVHLREGHYVQAGNLYKEAFDIFKQTLGLDHPYTAESRANRATWYVVQSTSTNSFQNAPVKEIENDYLDALLICKQALGADNPKVASKLNNLAELYRIQGKFEQAEQCFQEALVIYKQKLGEEHPITIMISRNYATLLKIQTNV